jgi:nuclear pore complex protein Nup98-Nup96
MKLSVINLVDGIPVVSLKLSTIKAMFHDQNLNDPASIHEKLTWELASILFDDLHTNNELLRKQTLSRYWQDLVDQATSQRVALARSSEEKAIACLAGHRILEACKHLIDGKNYHLATLMSLMGTKNTSKKDMRIQVDEWLEANMLSEFTEPIRAAYELLSGNVCVCEGKKGVPVEDRMDSFVISSRFGLDWKQSFGLRLWYGSSREDDISRAVSQFKDDIDQDKEARPNPWYIKQGIEPLWNDASIKTREDLLWGLLQLYSNKTVDLESVLRPENSQLSPLNYRLTWQLGQALTSTCKVSYGSSASDKSDAATYSFASQLVSEGNWLEAAFVLLHLSNPITRVKSIKDHLCRHAGFLGSEMGESFSFLTQVLKIPSSWIWEARALYMRSVKKDSVSEVQCLLRAGSYVDAHHTFIMQVAPTAVIKHDYESLSSILSQFANHQSLISNWIVGGEVYEDFLALVRCQSERGPPPLALLDKLVASLPAIHEGTQNSSVLGIAAVTEMATVVAQILGSLVAKDRVGGFSCAVRVMNTKTQFA